MNRKGRTKQLVRWGLAVAACLGLGCSDRSRMNLYIDRISGASAPNNGKTYLEVDLIGNDSDQCNIIQDTVTVLVRETDPSTLSGTPVPSAFITGYQAQFFYYDPADGQLKGPVTELTLNSTNAREHLFSGESLGITIPLVTYGVKAWSQGVLCGGRYGYPGPGGVNRMISRITMVGEDSTGKKLSASGDIMFYLYNYGPYPDSKAVPLASCFGFTPSQWLSGYCR